MRADMKKWKLWSGVLLIFLLGALSGALGAKFYFSHRLRAFVEPGPPPVRFIMRKMARDLELSEKQKKAIEKILQDSTKRFEKIRKKFHPEAQALREQTLDRMKAHLDDAQKKKLKELRKRLERRFSKHGRKSFHRKRTPDEILSFMASRLELTEDQSRKIRPILEESLRETEKIRESFKGKKRGPMPGYREEIQKIQSRMRDRLDPILTEAQRTKLRQMEKDRQDRRKRGHRPPPLPFPF
jgi:hypothetical protein